MLHGVRKDFRRDEDKCGVLTFLSVPRLRTQTRAADERPRAAVGIGKEKLKRRSRAGLSNLRVDIRDHLSAVAVMGPREQTNL